MVVIGLLVDKDGGGSGGDDKFAKPVLPPLLLNPPADRDVFDEPNDELVEFDCCLLLIIDNDELVGGVDRLYNGCCWLFNVTHNGLKLFDDVECN
ncbi:unnamed protein product [Schistosoma curassoni]|uniref:Uncharacterized protein n=1 Tax=Schistosoma curassoni TaxID=6186 RepID=A0A183KI99_9TREM|nr:unnamed protein product [Schistosoma curassoni]